MSDMLHRRRLSRRGRRRTPDPRVQPIKRSLIDRSFRELGVRSFADLGGVWAVEAGYTFHALNRFRIARALLVDTGLTDAVRSHAGDYPELELVEQNFGDPKTIERIGSVDAVFMFDVLLHQVDPDWDDVLRMYAKATNAFLIVNPQYVGTSTVRLIDLGREEYLRIVPSMPQHEEVFDKPNEIDPRYGRRWRDIHEIWQWGIVDADLDRVLAEEGFTPVFDRNAGSWFGLERFENRAVLYARR